MKIALAQLNYHIGNFEANTQKIIQTINQQKANGVDLVVFAELSISGYPPRDFLEYPEFIELCKASADEIAEATQGIGCIIGLPIINPLVEGKDLYNAAFFIADGEIKQIIKKALLPTYDVFDEYRYFEPAHEFNCIDYKGYKIALTICEDLWNLGDNPLYKTCPMDVLMEENPDFMINIAASPFAYNHDEERVYILSKNCHKYKLPLFYVNQVGAQTEIIFDGGSLVFDKAGDIIHEFKYFEEDVQVFDIEHIKNATNSIKKQNNQTDTAQIYHALILGIKDYFSKSGFKQAVLGLSGGIDSAVVCALACEALGAENVMSVLMPSKYSSDHSIKDAEELVKNIGCKTTIIPIKDITEAFELTMQPEFKDLPENITEENIQARSRGVILMAMSNKFGYILLNTSNKSEIW